jgi:hypothetical protein
MAVRLREPPFTWVLTKQRWPTRVGKHHAENDKKRDNRPNPLDGLLGSFVK